SLTSTALPLLREYDCHERVPVDLDAERDGVRRNRRKSMSRAKTLVTGATGMTGSHTVQLLLKRGLEVTPLAECGAIFAKVLDRLASGALRLPPAKRHRPQNIADALRDADGAPREGKPLLDLSSWAAD